MREGDGTILFFKKNASSLSLSLTEYYYLCQDVPQCDILKVVYASSVPDGLRLNAILDDRTGVQHKLKVWWRRKTYTHTHVLHVSKVEPNVSPNVDSSQTKRASKRSRKRESESESDRDHRSYLRSLLHDLLHSLLECLTCQYQCRLRGRGCPSTLR